VSSDSPALPEAIFATLTALVELMDRPASRHDIAALTGLCKSYLHRMRYRLESLGWIAVLTGRWWITERGKIVLAIERGRRSKAIYATGKVRNPPPIKAYLDAAA
jgi:DNA-binding IclR family transcriptional regulator